LYPTLSSILYAASGYLFVINIIWFISILVS
jgi:hypothetical protein